ncbi:hypothetical protein D3C72_2124490 [compost metagenome]
MLVHAAGSYSRCTDTDTARDERARRIKRNGILVDGNADGVEYLLGVFARNVQIARIHEHHMVVGAARHNVDAFAGQRLGQHLGVLHYIFRICLEGWLQRFTE